MLPQSFFFLLPLASAVLSLTVEEVYDKIQPISNGNPIVFYTWPAGGTDASEFAQTIDGLQTWDDFFETGAMYEQKVKWQSEDDNADDIMSQALGMLSHGEAYLMVKDTNPADTSVWVRMEYPELEKNDVKITAVNANKKFGKPYETADYTPHKNPWAPVDDYDEPTDVGGYTDPSRRATRSNLSKVEFSPRRLKRRAEGRARRLTTRKAEGVTM